MARVNEEVASLLIPMQAKPLLLPNVTVAEIVDWIEPQARDDVDDPGWMLGMVNWRGVNIPLISMEMMQADEADEEESESLGQKIAILNGVSHTQEDFYAISVQGIPRLVRVYPLEITTDEEFAEPMPYRMAVSVNGEKALIPNLDHVEAQLKTVLSA